MLRRLLAFESIRKRHFYSLYSMVYFHANFACDVQVNDYQEITDVR